MFTKEELEIILSCLKYCQWESVDEDTFDNLIDKIESMTNE